MKKRNFITGFSAAFVATMALVSCGGIRAKTGVVLTINGHEYTAEELFNSQKTPAAAEAKFNAVYKVAIRRYFENGQEGFTYMDDITRNTKIKISGAKEEARNNASKNGTKYDVEWKKILTSNGVDDETGLYNKFEYDLQKEKFEDKFYEKAFENTPAVDPEGKYKYEEYKNNYDVLRNGGKFHDYKNAEPHGNEIKGFFKEKQPYHMKHILVKIDAKENDDITGEISADKAIQLYKIAYNLVVGDLSFEQIARRYSDDDQTKTIENHGSLGIMTRDTGYVNDFKLGTYLYEAFYGQATKEETSGTESYNAKKASKELFNTDTFPSVDDGTAAYYANQIATAAELKDPTNKDTEGTNIGIGQIPYAAFEMLKPYGEAGLISDIKGYGDVDLSDNDHSPIKQKFTEAKLTSDKVKAKYFPRNVIFNKYFNKHRVMVITPTKTDENYLNNSANYLKKDTTSGIVSRKLKEDTFTVASLGDTAKGDIGEGDYSAILSKKGFDETKVKAKNNDKVDINTGDTATSSSKNKVLRDENGRTVLVFRSGSSTKSTSNDDKGYQGIHFIVIERSPFIGTEFDDNGEPGTSTQSTSLNDYYTQYYPGEVDGHHPTYKVGDVDVDKKTYANFAKGEIEELRKRSDTVKTELKKADDNLNTYLFDYLCDKGSLVFAENKNGIALKASIDNWINITKRENSAYEKTTKWNKDWKTYYYNLKARNENRENCRLIPEICVDAFIGKELKPDGGGSTACTLLELFGEGGAFNG